MAPKKNDTSLDPKEVNPINLALRRKFMERYFKALVVDEDLVKEARKKSEQLMSRHLAAKGLRDVNVKYFEYHVDVTVWKLILRDLNRLKAHPWPWTLSIDMNDLTEGISQTFRDWCRSNMSSSAGSQGGPSVTRQATPQLSQYQAPGDSETPESSVALRAPQTPAPQTPSSARAGDAKDWTVAPRRPTSTRAPAASLARIQGLSHELESMTLSPAPQADKEEKAEEKSATEVGPAAQAEAEAVNAKAKVSAHMAAKQKVADDLFKAEMSKIKLLQSEQTGALPGLAQSCWANREDDGWDHPYLSSLDPKIQVREDFGARNKEGVEEPRLPTMALREKIWDTVVERRAWPSGPIVAPFELALPEWLDFHDLIYHEFDRIEKEKLLDEDIVIAWRVVKNRPVSLILGPDPRELHAHEERRFWILVRSNWWRVAFWLAGAYSGSPVRLVDYLRQYEKLAEKNLDCNSEESIVHLVKAWYSITQDPLYAHEEARAARDKLDNWTPQIHAILCQPRDKVESLLEQWVYRAKFQGYIVTRLDFARAIWAQVATIKAYDWHHRMSAKLEVERWKESRP
ncbi:hypothetical protein FBEOM_3288 [Fusarium beomiforme]|uniref:Uncharacterized protein n=1 Tax=Fusarium beomiforme TaxID=44412 RepID=A0A9P5AQC9_9HYPO|nr:hypothetical protein FBEOM_3288 [Fusarium beomiforme]